MDQLRILLFGGVEVRSGTSPLPAFPTKRAELLFAYLVLNRGRLVHRDVLCGQLWGEQPDTLARKILRTELWRIRSVIEPRKQDRGTFLRVEGDQLGFVGPGDAWVDAWEFEECAAVSPTPFDTERLERAACLYRGDLLEGHYQAWCLLHRDRLRTAYLTALERLLSDHQRQGRWLDAIARGKELLGLDPLREHVHRAVMRCHLAMGDRPSALRQHEVCTRTLRDELDIDPMDETTRLREQILRGEAAPPFAAARETSVSGLPDEGARGLAAEVESALRAVYALAERLERTRSALMRDAQEDPPATLEVVGARASPRWRPGVRRLRSPEIVSDNASHPGGSP